MCLLCTSAQHPAHLNEVLLAHADRWRIDGWGVEEDAGLGPGVKTCACVHCVRDDASFVCALMPVPGVVHAGVLHVVVPDDRCLQSVPLFI